MLVHEVVLSLLATPGVVSTGVSVGRPAAGYFAKTAMAALLE
jgi:hypothetical protein